MAKIFLGFAMSFIILFLVNITFVVLAIYSLIIGELQTLLRGLETFELVYFSSSLKWILLADGCWILLALIFMIKRKRYKTDINLHYLRYEPINDPIIAVIIPTYNEELAVEKVVKDFINQKNVKHVLVIDNHSTDRTVEIAKRCGATVITKESNKGYSHSLATGLNEALKTNANVIVTTDADGTFDAGDIVKMMPYLDNSDMVIGTRQIQILTEKGNQNSMFLVWGNFFLAKLIQIKYFSLLHMGVVQLTDVGCAYRCIRRSALEKIIDHINEPLKKKIIENPNFLLNIFLIMLLIENNLKIVEVPITFKRRIGISKSEARSKTKAIKYGLHFMWLILNR